MELKFIERQKKKKEQTSEHLLCFIICTLPLDVKGMEILYFLPLLGLTF